MLTASVLALVLWAATGIAIGLHRSDVVRVTPGGGLALCLIWAACGPFAGLLPRG